jgi:hypothetical protein
LGGVQFRHRRELCVVPIADVELGRLPSLVAIVTVMLNVVLGVVPGQIVEMGDVALARAVWKIELNGCTQSQQQFHRISAAKASRRRGGIFPIGDTHHYAEARFPRLA